MEKIKPKNQKSILDFFRKTANTQWQQNEVTVLKQSQGNVTIALPRIKRKRAISKNVKKVVRANKKRNIETIILSDESDLNRNDVSSDQELFHLEKDSFMMKNEIVQDILNDWHTPEKNEYEDKHQSCSKLNIKLSSNTNETYDLSSAAVNDINKEETCMDKYTEKENKYTKIEVSKALFETTPYKPIINSIQVCSSSSSYGSSLKTSRILSSERTPTPSPCQSSKSATISPYIRNSPGKFNLLIASLSPKTPSPLNRSVKNVTIFANSSNYGNTAKRKLSLDEVKLTEGLSDDLNTVENSFSPSSYRNVNGLYLDNFNFIMECVMSSEHDRSLFNDGDNKVIDNFHTLSLQAKKFYVRLFQRKLRWLQYVKICYLDICEKEDAYLYLNELVYSEFLQSEGDLDDVTAILNILGKKELQQLCKDFKVKPIGTREDIINNLIKNSKTQKTILSSFGKNDHGCLLSKRAKRLVGKCCILKKDARNIFIRMLTLFSLPSTGEDEDAGQQAQLKILLMQKLGKLEFPSYKVIRSSSIFSCRESLIQFTKCYQLDCNARDFIEKKNWDKVIDICSDANIMLIDLLKDPSILLYDASLPPFLRRFTSISVLLYIQSHLVDALQKLKKYEEAVSGLEFLLAQKVHLQDCRGRWYDRLALNYDLHLKNPEKALNIIMEALDDPEVMVGHRYGLSQRAERIMKSKKGKHNELEVKFKGKIEIMEVKEAPKLIIEANSLPSDVPGFKRIYISNENEGSATEKTSIISSVEELVMTHYNKQGYPHGLHGEMRSIRVIFGLLFWDCIYSAIPDAFFSPYQGAPLDLNSRHFYEARKHIIDKRLSDLRQMSIELINEEITEIWEANEGKVSVVNWSFFNNLEHVKGLISCLGIELIAAICERLCKNHRFTRSGFPDLILWNTVEKTSRIIEVKGPNDKLSTKQILWLEFLIDNGATAEVCHVEALGAKRRKLKTTRIIENNQYN